MSKTRLILEHEFRQTVRRTGFIVLTIVPPLIALLAIGISHAVSGISRPPAEVTRVGYVDEAGGFSQFTTQGKIVLVPFDTQAAARQALVGKDVP